MRKKMGVLFDDRPLAANQPLHAEQNIQTWHAGPAKLMSE
jgi:hypothetical protein